MLKAAWFRADAERMFMPCFNEPTVCESTIVAFCAALNTPVVNIEALDVGAARAGIMLAAGEYGDLKLLVRVSLISGGEGITFEFQGDPREFGDASAAMDAALSFSEGMGFLFEEDLLTQGGRSGRKRASKIWTSLCSPREEDRAVVEAPACEPLPPRVAVAGTAPELELTDLLVADPPADAAMDRVAETMLGPESSPSVESQTQLFVSRGDGPGESPDTAAVGSPVLTKFRNRVVADREDQPIGATPGSNTQELARIELASEQVASEVLDHSGFLTRLLSSYWVST